MLRPTASIYSGFIPVKGQMPGIFSPFLAERLVFARDSRLRLSAVETDAIQAVNIVNNPAILVVDDILVLL